MLMVICLNRIKRTLSAPLVSSLSIYLRKEKLSVVVLKRARTLVQRPAHARLRLLDRKWFNAFAMADTESPSLLGCFPGKTLYEILGVDKQASTKEIKTAYRKYALKYHPDKNPGDESATKKFQALSFAHALLNDPERRSLYDETGQIDEDEVNDASQAHWYEYWRNLFPQVTKEDIVSFEEKYKGSDEEKADILQAYETYKGNMSKIMGAVILASELDGDEDRFIKIIEEAIKAEKVSEYKAFRRGTSSTAKKKRQRKAAKEAEEAEALASLIRDRHKGSLSRLPSKREKDFMSHISALEDKYVKKPRKRATGAENKPSNGSRKKQVAEPSEEEFLRIQKELLAKKK